MRVFLVWAAVLVLSSCAAESPGLASDPSAEPQITATPTPVLSPTEKATAVAPDLQRLAEEFIRYALGDADTFPHADSVSLSIGGRVVVSIDDFEAALSNREIWKICPADWEIYGASSCPVDLLGPIRSAEVNKATLLFEAEYDDVACAPTRSGPLPSGRLVVIKHEPLWRTCASDFALALVADEQGRLQSVDITLSVP